MSLHHLIDDERVLIDETGDEKRDIVGNLACRIDKGGEPPTAMAEQEKRMRREIANSNERRRMQSINNGFQSLRSLLPHHEGEKLSKAAILQQTAEYIYNLEQEKTRLLSQNCQLKRLLGQHEGGELPPKKRMKTELIIQDNADEGLGSMSPELITLTVNTSTASAAKVEGVPSNELKLAFERERNLRLLLEDQVRQLEQQIYSQQHQAVTETQIQFLSEESDEISGLQLVAADSLPPVAHTQTVVCSPPTSRCSSPETILPTPIGTKTVVVERIGLDRLPSVLEAAIKAEPKVEVERLPSSGNGGEEEDEEEETIDEETLKEAAAAGRLYTPGQLSHTSRQNLETIVEAIRHLEGDHMFGEEPAAGGSRKVVRAQDVPLALTTRADGKLVKAAVDGEKTTLVRYSAATLQQHQQSRPGVIVVKQAS